jgi:hypothetical protein
MGLKLSKSTSTKPRRKAPADSLNADTLDVICSFCDEQTLVSNYAHASKTIASAVDAHAAARARAYWTTSAELERRGVRLGAAFLARRSRPPRRAADGSRITLASRPLVLTSEEALARELHFAESWSPEWWAAKKQTLSAEDLARCEPIFGHKLDDDAIDEIKYAQDEAARRPSALRLPGRVLLVDVTVRDINGVVVGRRSVLVDGTEPFLAPGRVENEETSWADELQFADSLRIASGLEPDWFFRDRYNDDHHPWETQTHHTNRLDNAWLAEVANVVGAHQTARAAGDIYGYSEINHDWPDQLLEHGHVDEHRSSQLPENRRFVSVRVDLFRLADGKSMCLGEHDVGVQGLCDWPGDIHWHGQVVGTNPILPFIPLTASDDLLEKESILERPYDPELGKRCADEIFAPQCHAIAAYPDAAGELHIRGVRLGFCCPAHPGDSGMPEWGDYQNNPHLGDRVVRVLLTLDAWT